MAERNAAFLQVSYHYDDAGRLLDRILSNGAQTAYAYDAGSRLVSLTHVSADGTLLQTTAYTHDAVGNIETAGGVIYAYDPLHRLIDADFPGTADDRSYTYDAVGNRKTETTAAGTFDYTYGAGNRLSEIRRASDSSLVNSFDYDDNGSVLVKRDGTGSPIYTLVRNDRGQVISATGPGFSDAFGYDPRGLRIRRDDGVGSHLFHLEGENLEAVYAAGGALEAKYLRGSIIDEVVNGYLFDGNGKPTNFTYHHDQVTSVVALTGHAGTIEETMTFAPFGEEIAATGSSANPLRFTGRERDPDAGLYYFRARYYDPAIGRFLSEDPLGFDGGDVNLYAYVGNNPLRFNDPNGQIIPQLVGGTVGSITAVISTKLANPDASTSDLLLAGGLGFGGGFLLATPFAATGAQVLVAATVVGGASNFTAQAIFKGVENVNLVETGIFAGLSGFSAIPSAAAATAELSLFEAASLSIAQAPKGVALDLLGGSFADSIPDFTVGQLIGSPPPYPGTPDDFNPVFDVYCSPKCF